MDINQLKQTYNIELDEIVNALKKHNITIRLRQFRNIPENWLPLIEDYLNADATVNNEDQRSSKDFNRRNKAQRKSKNSLSRSVPSKKVFYAYVKYVGPENDHAFIAKLSDINAIASQDFYEDNDNDYKLDQDCASINKGQIILCTVKSKKYRTAKIHATVFQGILSQNGTDHFTDWVSFKNPEIIKNIMPRNFDDGEVIISTKLFWDRPHIVCENANEGVNTDAILPKVEHLFQQYIAQPEIKENEITTIYKSLISTEVYEKKLRQRFNSELEDESLFSGPEKIGGFLRKWELLAPNLVTYSNLRKEGYFDLFFQEWLDGTVNIDFWEEHIIDACVQYQLSFAENDNNEEKKALGYVLTQDHLSKIESVLPEYFNYELIIDTLRVRCIVSGHC